MAMRRRLRPVLDGPWWLIGPTPDLEGTLEGDAEHRRSFEKGVVPEHNAPVDHHVMRDPEGLRHLWGCVRATPTGRAAYSSDRARLETPVSSKSMARVRWVEE